MTTPAELIEQATLVVGDGCWTTDEDVVHFLDTDNADLHEVGAALMDFLESKKLNKQERQIVWLLACKYFDRPDHLRSQHRDWRGRKLPRKKNE